MDAAEREGSRMQTNQDCAQELRVSGEPAQPEPQPQVEKSSSEPILRPLEETVAVIKSVRPSFHVEPDDDDEGMAGDGAFGCCEQRISDGHAPDCKFAQPETPANVAAANPIMSKSVQRRLARALEAIIRKEWMGPRI